jgi:hypothetical protein
VAERLLDPRREQEDARRGDHEQAELGVGVARAALALLAFGPVAIR